MTVKLVVVRERLASNTDRQASRAVNKPFKVKDRDTRDMMMSAGGTHSEVFTPQTVRSVLKARGSEPTAQRVSCNVYELTH